ncbi:MAG TPA: cytidine deaminase [Chloroflexota bacterium]|nr:cytidine deaminase [Chloroflexota bacterium]
MENNESAVDELIAAAWRARENAYAPYSGFAVGAAARGASGRIYPGVNVENASYGLTICAERAAIAAAVAAGERTVPHVAVVTGAELVTPPCGACRQVLAEFGVQRVVAENSQHRRESWRLAELLPHPFGPGSLGTDPPASETPA